MFAFLLLASSALAHHVVEQPSLGRLILGQEVVVRGAVVRESRMEGGVLVARLRVEKVLKGSLREEEVEFASDPDHGVRYRAGERALVFLSRADRRQPALVSPQVFAMKYPITSFDPSGYDGLVSGLLAAERLAAPAARLRRLKEVMLVQLASHEKAVRSYAAGQLVALARRDGLWDGADWRRLEALAHDTADGDVRRIVLRLLDSRTADDVGRAERHLEGSAR